MATEEVNIWKTTQEGYPIVQDIMQRMRHWQVRSAFGLTPQGLLVHEENGQRKLVVLTSMRQKVMALCHDEPTKGHPTVHGMVELVKQRYWWKGIGKDIENYMKSCSVCQVMKSDHKKKVGPLQPIPIPTKKWEQITTNSVTDLPLFSVYTAIAVFVDRLTKMVHFAPCTKEINADQYAQVFIDNVFLLHGTSQVIISDQDPRFTSQLWTQFFQILRMDLRLSTTFHPQTDGQSEVTICMLENFLQPYVKLHPHVWSKRLSLVDFAVNNDIKVLTDYTLFFLNSGENPTLLEHLVISLGSTSNYVVNEAINQMKEALNNAKCNLAKAQDQMK